MQIIFVAAAPYNLADTDVSSHLPKCHQTIRVAKQRSELTNNLNRTEVRTTTFDSRPGAGCLDYPLLTFHGGVQTWSFGLWPT